jgi:lysozyme
MIDYLPVLDDKLKKQLFNHEGNEPSAYQDSLGYWTIGVGHLIDKRLNGRLSDSAINFILNEDITQAWMDVKNLPWYTIQDDVRKGVIVELSFNMGLPKLLKFDDFIKYLTKKDYTNACLDLRGTKWAHQVQPDRISDICYRLTYGAYK